MPQSPKSKLSYSDPLASTYSVPMLFLRYTGGDIAVSAGTTHTLEWTTPAVIDTHEMWQPGNPSVIDFVNVPTALYWFTWHVRAEYGETAPGYWRLDNDTTQNLSLETVDAHWTKINYPYRIENGQTLRFLIENASGVGVTLFGDAVDNAFVSIALIPGTESRS